MIESCVGKTRNGIWVAVLGAKNNGMLPFERITKRHQHCEHSFELVLWLRKRINCFFFRFYYDKCASVFIKQKKINKSVRFVFKIVAKLGTPGSSWIFALPFLSSKKRHILRVFNFIVFCFFFRVWHKFISKVRYWKFPTH